VRINPGKRTSFDDSSTRANLLQQSEASGRMTVATLAKLSTKDVNHIAKELKAAGVPRGFKKKQFCKLWSEVKPSLEIIQQIVARIPGYGAIISPAIGVVLTIGNAISKAYC
jgi:hypothetical protein